MFNWQLPRISWVSWKHLSDSTFITSKFTNFMQKFLCWCFPSIFKVPQTNIYEAFPSILLILTFVKLCFLTDNRNVLRVVRIIHHYKRWVGEIWLLGTQPRNEYNLTQYQTLFHPYKFQLSTIAYVVIYLVLLETIK